MAHKKAGGSTRNGRDLSRNDLGLRNMVGKLSEPETFSFGKRGTQFHPETMLVAVRSYSVRYFRWRGGVFCKGRP